MASTPKKKPGMLARHSGLPRRGKAFVPPATITLPPMLQSGGDVAFRETLYLMVLAFGRLYTCREASADRWASPLRSSSC